MFEQHHSIADLCRELGIGRTTLWRMVRDGRLQPPRRISPGRVAFPASEIENYLTACKRGRIGGAS